MSEPTPIRVPLDNVNDDSVKLLSWAVREGQEVQGGQLLAELETSKAVVEIIAPKAGRVWIKVQAGQEVPVGVVLGYITTNGTLAADIPQHPDVRSQSAVSSLPAGTSFSKKALELLERHGLSPETFTGRAMVREQDVRDYLSAQATTNKNRPDLHFAVRGLALEDVTLPKGLAGDDHGLLDPKFLEKLRNNAASFAKLSAATKCDLYRRHGAHIGENVVFGAGAVLVAPRLVIGDEADFGENSSVVCRERFVVGALSSFRHDLNIRGGTVVLGENIYAGQGIRIGGGGNADPWSVLAIGDGTYLGDDLFINICRPVLIGKQVFLTQRSILVTHNIGHSVLDGYENRFAPIVLEDYAQVGMNSTIYAGTTIGRGAVVGSNSYVVSSIPAGKMALGVPARVVRDATRHLDRDKQLQIVRAMMAEYRELLELKGLEASPLDSDKGVRFSVERNGSRFQLLFVETWCGEGPTNAHADETVIWTLDSASGAVSDEETVMDLLRKRISGPSGPFAESTREFLRKRGIRCEPGPWRYKGGFI